nr:hypothetical protein [Actinoplanes polyasparticus]
MDATWAQLLVGLLAVVSLFVGATLGGIVLAYTPLHQHSDAAVERR